MNFNTIPLLFCVRIEHEKETNGITIINILLHGI